MVWASAAMAQTADPGGMTLAQRRVLEADIAGGPRYLLAPGTRVPKIGGDATALAYTKWAKDSLGRGQTAEAELSLEWAQVRRRIDEESEALQANKIPPVYDAACERMLCKAMQNIGRGGKTSDTLKYLNTAIDDMSKRSP
jgi:hypothetical protein